MWIRDPVLVGLTFSRILELKGNTVTLSNTARLTRICEVLQEDGCCLEAAQIRSWMDGLSPLALTKIDDMDTDSVFVFSVKIASAMLLGEDQLDIRSLLAAVLSDFTDRHLNLHAIA